ncbi:MAG: M28 family peptidase [Anaerolineae bacterium]|nr:M28 family peptidase [Anaerolineae bacterium]
MKRYFALGLALLACGVAISCGRSATSFSGLRARRHIEKLCAFGERPVGSAAHDQAAAYIANVLQEVGWEVEIQRFAFGGKNLQNVIGKKGQGPLIILGTHYDTRPLADRDPADRSRPVMGANDGGSGTAVLLELARVLGAEATDQVEIWLTFFDGEAHGDIDGWPWNVGARYLADQISAQASTRPEYVLVVDMVGDAEQRIYYEWSSNLWLQERVWQIAAEQGYGAHFIPEHKYRIEDDHTPFVRWGMTAAVMIDFDYPYWHTQHDTLDKISVESLQRVGLVLQTLLEGRPLDAQAARHAGP